MYRLICGFAVLVAVTPAAAAPVALDADRWQQLSSVSRAAFALPDVRDSDRHGAVDTWDVADAAGGDCEDKALFARDALIAKGWPSTSLRLALVWTETQEYHAVLTIDVVLHGEPATYVIDSRFAWVLGWDVLSRHGYRWDRRQSVQGPGWIHIAQPRP
jgi:predicted transglutaminase-like cysteine proteinase